MKKIIILSITIIILTLTTGCLKQDKMEDINIITTIYPIEYITNRLYSDNASVKSIYPKNANINDYKLTEKQIKDFSNNDLFIYNGHSVEKDYAVAMVKKNRSLKIIDAAYGFESATLNTDIWTNPANILMMAGNIKNELSDYIYSKKLIDEINDKYEDLKVDITELETEFKNAYNNSVYRQIVTADESLNFLERYGFEVISLTKEGKTSENNLALANKLLSDKKISYVFVTETAKEYDVIKTIKDEKKFEIITYRTLDTLTEKDIENGSDYLSLMHSNIDKIKQETYK